IIGNPANGLGNFVRGLTGLGAETAPASSVIPGLVANLDLTFGAFNRQRSDLQDAIGKSPDLLGTLTKKIPVEARIWRATATLTPKLEPGTSVLPETAPVLADALQAGSKNLPLVPQLSERSALLIHNLADYATQPAVVPGSLRIAETLRSLRPLVDFLAPAENTCAYLSLMLRNLSSTLSESLSNGTALRPAAAVVDTTRTS